MQFKHLLEKIQVEFTSKKDQDKQFKRLVKKYLVTDPRYNFIKEIWLWNKFPFKKEFGKKNIAIDWVLKTSNEEYWAVQAKFCKTNKIIDKNDIESFLITSSKAFTVQDKKINFSQRLFISATNKWSENAEEAISYQKLPITRILLRDLENASLSWSKVHKGFSGKYALQNKKITLQHQKKAIAETHEYFKRADRGKLIMAFGTGKIFTALKIVKKETDNNGFILFLVPSIELIRQALNIWLSSTQKQVHPMCVCADTKITKADKNNDTPPNNIIDIGFPVITDVDTTLKHMRLLLNKEGLKVIFSTYRSIEIISKAQKQYTEKYSYAKTPIFDLMICNEAHRTTGIKLSSRDSSQFIKVHENNFIQAEKRLYITATPRIYQESPKTKTDKNDTLLCSMDNETFYGQEIYKIGLGKALEKGLVSDYRVLVLTLSEKSVPTYMQNVLTYSENKFLMDNVAKLFGCLNALSKNKIITQKELWALDDPNPIKRVVAFSSTVKKSKKATSLLNKISDIYKKYSLFKKQDKVVYLKSKHVDDTMSSSYKSDLIDFLENNIEENQTHILSNATYLNEEVDLPSLDAALFLSVKNSQIEVNQSVARIMKKAVDKKYGYIIIPIVIPGKLEHSEVLQDNLEYKVIWSVLNALRAHDDRFDAIVNQLNLNKNKHHNILVGCLENDLNTENSNFLNSIHSNNKQKPFPFKFNKLQNIIYEKMVQKLDTPTNWENWAKYAAIIAENQIKRIDTLIAENEENQKIFQVFIAGLRDIINPALSKSKAIEILSQHLITKPIFETLSIHQSFTNKNHIFQSMEKMISAIETEDLKQEIKKLDGFYESVKKRVQDIDNYEGRQRIILELHNKFFSIAFPKAIEKLGIVNTPVEIVDFMIQSTNDILEREFDKTLLDENVNIMDPFMGTGTFIVRLIQSNLMYKRKIFRKYKNDLHANEIDLLAYYIATIKIESALYYIQEHQYKLFRGICLADTFQLGENKKQDILNPMFEKHIKNLHRQKNSLIHVMIGNLPYSVGKKSQNDDVQNQTYKHLEKRLKKTYIKNTNAKNNNSSYDSYIKAFRWASDRINSKNGGMISFISNAGWLNSLSQDGFRKSIEEEFSSIYIFDLKGNHTIGISPERGKKEGGGIFGLNSRIPITITFLIKKPYNNEKAKIYYHAIDDYLTTEQKLLKIKEFSSVKYMEWKPIKPNKYNDWVDQRNIYPKTFLPLSSKKENVFKKEKQTTKKDVFFDLYTRGVQTSRDIWAYNFSKTDLEKNMKFMISNYQDQLKTGMDKDPQKISWSSHLENSFKKKLHKEYDNNSIRVASYHPFTKKYLYFNKDFNDRISQQNLLFSEREKNNRIICATGIGTSANFSVLITDQIGNYDYLPKGYYFPLFYFDSPEKNDLSNTDNPKKENISDFIFNKAKNIYGHHIIKEDIFYYVYGLLHHKEYRKTFVNNLNKEMAQIPLLKKELFDELNTKGRELADLHLNYHKQPNRLDLDISGKYWNHYHVKKIKHLQKKRIDQLDTIIFNNYITISNIPLQAYNYILSGSTAIKWVMNRYQIRVDKKSGIKDDPNAYSNDPKYIFNLLLSVINMSVQTMDIVDNLPHINFDNL